MTPRTIVIHCSASRWGRASDIDQWHKARGFARKDGGRVYHIGYHAVVLNGYATSRMQYSRVLDGKIEPGRPDHLTGAHCAAGGMNSRALGVCLIGLPGWADYSERQISALVHYLATKCRAYGIPVEQITQHSDHDRGKPLCASLDMQDIRDRVQEALS